MRPSTAWIAVASLAAIAVGAWLLAEREGSGGEGGDPVHAPGGVPAPGIPGPATVSTSPGGPAGVADPAGRRDPSTRTRASFQVRLVDESGRPVDGALVLAMGDPAPSQTREGDVYRIEGLLPLSVGALAKGWLSPTPVQVTEAPKEVLVLRFARAVAVQVEVRGDALPGVEGLEGTVWVERTSGERVWHPVVLDARGTARLEDLAAGRARLAFGNERFSSGIVEAELADGVLVSLAVRPRPAGALRVRARGTVAAVRASVPSVPDVPGALEVPARVDVLEPTRREGAVWIFDPIPAGPCEVHGSDAEDAVQLVGKTTVAAGATAELEIVPPPG